MSSTVMMERTGMGLSGVGMPFVTTPTTPTTGYSVLAVPRCTFKAERTTDGCKVYCTFEDQTACSTFQNLCQALAGGMCTCCLTYNGVTVCSYNFMFGTCKWELTSNGCCFYCTSGDQQVCSMIQSFCDCFSTMLSSGCHCCWYVNNTPICWGCSGTTTSAKTKK